jgi:hypothetical protein
MDLAQIPKSEGIDIERWIYYLKEFKIGFINSFEESNKGTKIGQTSHFNQFQSIDLSLANSIQQYINYLDYIQNQIYYVSGVTPQRLGSIKANELVGNAEAAVNQSSLITEYLFEAHAEVKRRVYTGLIEVAKIAWRTGKTMQFVNDDLGIDILNIEEFEFENSEFNVFVSNLPKDRDIKAKLDQLSQIALEQGKADLSTIIDTILNDSPTDIIATLRRAEEQAYERQQQQQQMQQQMQQEQIAADQEKLAMELEEKQKDRDLKQYEIDTNNQTRIQVAEINVYNRQADIDQDNDGIPDPVELANLSLKEREVASKAFSESQKIKQSKEIKDKELAIKTRELEMKKEIEDKKIKAIQIQNDNQIELANKKAKLDKEIMDKKLEIERLKIKSSKNKNKDK